VDRSRRRTHTRSNTSRDLSIPEVHEYVRGLGLPGRVEPIGYEIDAERPWLTHVLDIEALTAWLTHRVFHLIK